MSKKNAIDLSALVSTKGTAVPTQTPTRASVQPPAPAPAAALDNKNTAPLNFRVPVEFRKRFKQAALDNDMTQTELLSMIFNEFQAKNGEK